uniref:Uncharacterized protein n=1 Tax=Avena sativa TaxID=4498 RepID=A0ACD5TG69_AVESA
MEEFPDGHYVWLRSRVHGTYLHADKDGRGVYLSDRRMSMKSAWAVHLYGDEQRVLLHNAANGRYLSATNSSAFGCRGCRVALRNFYDADDVAIRWQPVKAGSQGPILLRQIAVDGRDGYLRANGRNFTLNENRVTVDYLHIISTMMEWVVYAIPTSVRIPQLPGPPMINFSALLLSRVVTANGQGYHANDVSFSFRGRYVFRLREELIRRLGIHPADNLVMYVQAGTYGRRIPLVVNLPHNIHALVITVETPDIGGPRYPDFEL